MITERSVEEVKDKLDIVEVAKLYTKLEKHGAGWSGCCPFHQEKSASFHVSPERNIYKCFGCGASGDAIKLVMEKDAKDYPDALRKLAAMFKVTLEETVEREEDRELKEKRITFFDLNEDAAKRWQEALWKLKPAGWHDPLPEDAHWALRELREVRQLSEDMIVLFQIGYAPDMWKFLTTKLVSSGFFAQAEELGLVTRGEKSEQVYDTYRDRIMFPIHNLRGKIVGFGGRKGYAEKDANAPKYLNSKASMVYRKEAVLYGLYQGAQAIRKEKCAFLVEGYFDVIMMHQAGIFNTVATCGTAFTESHAEMLAKLCDRVVLMNDGDNAGVQANLKAIDVLLAHNFIVQVCPLPAKHDPDSFVRSEFPACLPNYVEPVKKVVAEPVPAGDTDHVKPKGKVKAVKIVKSSKSSKAAKAV